jgi:hypothetical protein
MEQGIKSQALDADLLDNAATVRAMGHFAALLLTLLDREKSVDIKEFANLLSVFACITDEADRPGGLILAYWAGMLKEAAEDLQRPPS